MKSKLARWILYVMMLIYLVVYFVQIANGQTLDIAILIAVVYTFLALMGIELSEIRRKLDALADKKK